jgi:hypothetical protein
MGININFAIIGPYFYIHCKSYFFFFLLILALFLFFPDVGNLEGPLDSPSSALAFLLAAILELALDVVGSS